MPIFRFTAGCNSNAVENPAIPAERAYCRPVTGKTCINPYALAGAVSYTHLAPRAQSKLDQIADKLKLSKEQKEEAGNILNAAAESAGPLNQQIANGRQKITEAMVNGSDKGDDYNKLMGAYTAVLAQMDSVESTAYGKIYALLKPNQQKNGEPVFAEVMAGMFMRSGGGSGRKKSQ